jgi:hypothetical protein
MSDTATVATPALAQTTSQPAGGPFVRHSEPGKTRIYDLTGIGYNGLVNQPLSAIPGYVSAFRLRFTATNTQTATQGLAGANADAPFNVVQQIQVFDALGTPIYALPGYEAFKLIPLFSGGFGLYPVCDVANLPSYQPIQTGTAFAGQFQFATAIPLEFSKGIGVLGMADGSTLPKIQVQFNSASNVFGTAIGTTIPTTAAIEMRLNADFYWLPAGANVAPPGLGSTRQWFLQQGYPAIASGGSTATVTIPRQGGWLDTLIFELRDANNNRQDYWPTILRFKIDGIGEIETNIDEIYDDMAIAWGIGAVENNSVTTGSGGTTTAVVPVPRPTGVIAFSRKTSLGRQVLGLLDTYEVAMSTSAGTSMTVEGAPWATGANGPWTLNAILGQVIPSGALIQGLTEL